MANEGSTAPFPQTREGREGRGSARLGQVEEKQGARTRGGEGKGGLQAVTMDGWGLAPAMAQERRMRLAVGWRNRGARARRGAGWRSCDTQGRVGEGGGSDGRQLATPVEAGFVRAAQGRACGGDGVQHEGRTAGPSWA
jgi:hypothetical protein